MRQRKSDDTPGIFTKTIIGSHSLSTEPIAKTNK
jgi:hypothetical protein